MKRTARVLACAWLGMASAAHAQVDNTGVLDQALRQYRTAAEGWQTAAQGAATTLFWSLATISLVWTMGQLALRRAELGEFFGELIRYLLFTGFWAWMLSSGPVHARLIIESMIKLAGGASGQNVMSPSGIVDVGFQLVDRALTQSSILSPLDSAIGVVLALVILVVLALVAVNMLVTLIACWIIAYGGLVVLGFGGSRWTSDMAINYYRMVLSLGLQVLAMVLLVGIGESFLRGYYDALEQDVSLHEQAVLLVVSIVLLATVNRVPALLGTLANGSSPQYALGSGAGAGTALSTASAAAALAATASRPALEGAGQLAKASAMAAIGGSAAAAASLLDGFRSRDGEPPSGASGGSVFPAAVSPPALHQVAAGSGAATPDSSSPPGFAVSGQGAAAAPQAMDGDRGSETPARQVPEVDSGSIVRSSSEERVTEAELHAEHASTELDRNASSAARADTGTGEHDQPPTAAGAQSAAQGQSAARIASTAGASKASHAESADADPKGRNPSAWASPPPAGSAANGPASMPAATGGSPAGTFASTAAGAPSAPASSSSRVASPIGLSGPTPSLASSIGAARSSGALVGATARAASTSVDVAFTTSAAGEASPAAKPAHAEAPPMAAAIERSELPAAYSMQTTVDVEAEVAAFRDTE